MKVGPIAFVESSGLLGCEKKRGVRNDSKVFAWIIARLKLLLTETGRSIRKQHFWMDEQEIGLRHSTFEIPARPPSGEVKWEVGYVTLQYNLKAQDGELYLGLTSLQMAFITTTTTKR